MAALRHERNLASGPKADINLPMDDAAEPATRDVAVYPFPDSPERDGYRLFPIELENDPLVAFHGTAEGNLQSIIHQGFRFEGGLPSCSFARGSPLALGYACKKRSEASPNGCVVVVRFRSFDAVKVETSIVYVYRPDRMPDVVGYCIVPASYGHQ
jgi:hypothetical protein